MVVGAVDGGTHEIPRAGIDADVVLVRVLLPNCPRDQATIRPRHKTAEFREEGDVAHACRHQDIFEFPTHSLADRLDIVRLLVRGIWNADAAGEVDEADMHAGRARDTHGDVEQNARQLRIVLVRDGIARKEGMDAELLGPLRLQYTESLYELVIRHAVFRIARIVHDAVRNFERAAGIVSARNGLRDAADNAFEHVDMRDVVQIDRRAELRCQFEILFRRLVRREHDVGAMRTAGIREHKLGVGRAIASAAVFLKDFDDERIRRRLHGEILAKTGVP